jgi:hypothetical protein
MSGDVKIDFSATLERLLMSRISAENWSDAAFRNDLYATIKSRLAAAAEGPEGDRNRQYLKALTGVSLNIEAAARAAESYEDFQDLVKAAGDEADSPAGPVAARAPGLPRAAGQPPARDMAAEPESPPSSAPPPVAPPLVTAPDDGRPVRTIPLWPLGLVALAAAVAITFWPSGACTLRTTTCAAERIVTAGPGFTEEEARQLRFAVLSLQVTPTHVFARVRVSNGSGRTLHAVSPNPLRLAHRVRSLNQAITVGRPDQFNPNRIELPQDVPPGGTIEVPLMSMRSSGQTAPVLDLSFVVENRFWAFNIGIEPLTTPLQ